MPYTQEWHVVYDAYRHHPMHTEGGGEEGGGGADTFLHPSGDHWSPKRAELKDRFLPPAKPVAQPSKPFAGAPVLYHAPYQIEPLKRLGCAPMAYHLDQQHVLNAHYRHLAPHPWY